MTLGPSALAELYNPGAILPVCGGHHPHPGVLFASDSAGELCRCVTDHPRIVLFILETSGDYGLLSLGDWPR